MHATSAFAGITFVIVLALSSAGRAEMHGDPEAIALADEIVASIGGREVWSTITGLHVFENSRSTKGAGIVGEFWRDLVTPRERYRLRNRAGIEVDFWWDERGVYQVINGVR